MKDLEQFNGGNNLVDVDAENMIVGSFLGGAGAGFRDASSILKSVAFSNLDNKIIWEAMETINKRNDNVDLISVYTEIAKSGDESLAVRVMAGNQYFSNNVIHTAMYLADLFDRRRLLAVSMKLQSMCRDMTAEVIDTVKVIKDMLMLVEDNEMTDEIAIKDIMTDLLYSCEYRINNPTEVGVMTGFRGIDKKGGLCSSDLSIIAGEPSNGKTSFAMSIAKNVSMSGIATAIYTLEMSPEQLAARMVAMQGRNVSSSAILHRPLTALEIDNVCGSAYKLMEMPMYFDKKSNANIDKMLASIKKMVYKFGVKVVVIDYLQLITTSSRNQDRVLQLAEISRALKNIAKELSISVLLLSQLKRDDDPVPTVKRLRGSGEIEEAADNVYLVYYAARYCKAFPGGWRGYSTHNTALIFQAKGRNSGVGEFLTKFYPEFTLFAGFADGEEMPKANELISAGNILRPDASGAAPY